MVNTQSPSPNRCQTRYFGSVAYNEDAVLAFPEGIPAFEKERRFLAIRQPKNEPLVFLQSLADPDLCFVALPVQSVRPGYRLSMSPEDLAELGLDPSRQPEIGRDVLCLTLLSLVENASPTVNLLAPIVVNLKSLHGLQAIQTDCPYSHRERLPLREAACW